MARLVEVTEEPKAKTYKLVLVDEPQPVTKASERFIKGLRDPIDAGAQLLTELLPSGIVNAGNELNNYLADKTGLVGRLPEGGVTQQIQDNAASYQAPEGVDWARLGGNILSPANLAIASKIPVAGSLAARVAGGAAGGAGMGALSPVENGNFADEKTTQIGFGAAGGAIAPLAIGAAGRVISPKTSTNANLAILKENNVTPTIGQTLGGAWNKAEEKLQSLPIMGDMISKARNSANSQFESAAYNRVLSPIKDKLPNGLSGRDALVYTETALGNKYDDVLNKIGAIKPDAEFQSSVKELTSLVNKKMMPKAEKAKFNYALEKIKSATDKNGVITSDAYKELESSLGKDAQKLASSQNIYEQPIGDAVKQLQSNLRDMLKRQAGEHANDLSSANKAWANFKRVQRAAGSSGADGGEFTPAQLQSAVKALDKSKDKAAFARGGALMQDLGDAGKSVLTGKVGNSFTADRLLMNGGALGSYAINPAIPAGIAAGGALYTKPVQKALNFMLTQRPDAAPMIADFLRKSSPYITGSTAGLLNQ